jgi:polysaccharide export outer membrane protein
MGEVRTPKSVTVGWDDLSLAQALMSAGGINEQNADAKGVFVLRDIIQYDDDGATAYRSKAFRLNVASATAFVLAEKFKLQPGDVVYVTAAPVARWNRLISSILPTILGAESLDTINK